MELPSMQVSRATAQLDERLVCQWFGDSARQGVAFIARNGLRPTLPGTGLRHPDEQPSGPVLVRAGRTAEGTLFYRGQLDGSRPGNEVPVTGRDLRVALDALLSGGKAPADQRPSLGCNIKWRPGSEPSA